MYVHADFMPAVQLSVDNAEIFLYTPKCKLNIGGIYYVALYLADYFWIKVS